MMTNQGYTATFYKEDQRVVTENDNWHYCIMSVWCKPFGGLCNIKVYDKQQFDNWVIFLDQVHQHGQEISKQQIRETLGIKD
jgi:hypothetical protein